MSRSVTVIFPHQLFQDHPALHGSRPVILVEDSLFFGDPRYPLQFHAHKLVLHCATMEHYAAALRKRGLSVEIERYRRDRTFRDVAAETLAGVDEVHLCHVADDVLNRRILKAGRNQGFTLRWYESPGFLTPGDWLRDQISPGVLPGAKAPRMSQFYIAQRRRMGILLEPGPPGQAAPRGGRWSFDAENRRSWPARTPPPPDPVAGDSEFAKAILDAAIERISREFPSNPGDPGSFWYPVTHHGALEWLRTFLRERLPLFGPYEDAIAVDGTVLYHSVLTPMLNTGLLTPDQVLRELDRVFPLYQNSQSASPAAPDLLPGVEGFVRQIIGWREYIRGVYLHLGVAQRTGNFWDHHHPMPDAFYTGTTGIAPVDQVIRRVLDRSWCHHIERLMVLGNVMLLCEIDPDAVYRWFMELFIDAYDWVMVPNVYGMSQFADGGLLATKPYISGANYIRKMSDYPRGPWEDTWTALFWRFLDRHRSYFAEQPRMGMLVRQLDRNRERTRAHHATAEQFLRRLRV